jgi:hypothetical protein
MLACPSGFAVTGYTGLQDTQDEYIINRHEINLKIKSCSSCNPVYPVTVGPERADFLENTVLEKCF